VIKSYNNIKYAIKPRGDRSVLLDNLFNISIILIWSWLFEMVLYSYDCCYFCIFI